MTSFADIFKKGFLEEVGNISLTSALITLGIALILALFIFLIYKVSFNGVVYSKNFNVSLVAVCLVTTVIVIAISTNIVLSLGMVGALSIVRFRTAVKEPIDVAYMYWAITTGIVCGARLYIFAGVATLVIGFIFFIMSRLNKSSKRHILVINFSGEALLQIEGILAKTSYVIKSRSISDQDHEYVMEVKIKKNNMAFLNNLQELKGVSHVSLVSYKGD